MRIQNSPFKKMTRGQALALVAKRTPPSIYAELNRTLYDGDHWMGGGGWIGPIPAEDNASYLKLKEEIYRAFCSRNVVREVIDRKVDGLLKNKPQTSWVRKKQVTESDPLTDNDKTLIAEADDLFRKWFKDKSGLKVLKKVYGKSQLEEKTVVRLYVPRGLLTDLGNGLTSVPKGDVEACLELIHISVHSSENVGEIVHEDTQLTGYICDIQDGDVRHTEIVYVEDDKTIIRTIKEEGATSTPEKTAAEIEPESKPWSLEIQGRMPMYEARVRPMITQQVRENQYAINLAKTMQNRNTVTAGFLERIVLDAMPPGEWKDDPDDPDKEVYEVGPLNLGAGKTSFFMAAEYRNKETGETKIGSPSVYFKDPVDPSTFIASKRDCYQDILEEVGQPHILIDTEATTTGRSREQARDTYRGTLEDDEGELNPLIVWMMETSLAMASYFAGEAGKFDTLQANAKCNINLGPLTGNERQDNREDVKSGQLSARTAMSRSGVEDPQAEFDRIAEEAGSSDDSLGKKLRMLQDLVSMGFKEMQAAKLVGLTEDQIANLVLKPLSERQPLPLVEPSSKRSQEQRDKEAERGAETQ